MNLVQQTFRPAIKSEQKRFIGTQFASDDDGFSVLASIYLGSSEERAEIVEDVTQVLRAYGFTNFAGINQAPGSYYLSIRARFGTNDRHAAQKSKELLQEDLLDEALPRRPPQKRRAVRKLQKSLGIRTKKGLTTIILIGTSFLAGLSKDVFKDAVKNEVEKWLKDNGPKIVRKADVVVAKRLPQQRGG